MMRKCILYSFLSIHYILEDLVSSLKSLDHIKPSIKKSFKEQEVKYNRYSYLLNFQYMFYKLLDSIECKILETNNCDNLEDIRLNIGLNGILKKNYRSSIYQ
jgi:hypothetical protein